MELIPAADPRRLNFNTNHHKYKHTELCPMLMIYPEGWRWSDPSEPMPTHFSLPLEAS
jgi:hypothetical protein